MTPELIVTDGTPGQAEAAHVAFSELECPWGWCRDRTVKISFSGQWWFTARGGMIVAPSSVLPGHVAGTMAHEVGHLADFWGLDWGERNRVLKEVHGPGDHVWDRQAEENWANSFAMHYHPGGNLFGSVSKPTMQELIMASSEQIRQWWAAYRCDPTLMERVSFPGAGRSWNLLVARESVPAWEFFAEVMTEHNYLFRESAGGTYNCRRINNDPDKPWSLHAYGVALDLNPSKNPYGSPLRYDYSDEFIADIEAHRSGMFQTFQWGGRWSTPDSMHWQVNVKPSEIEQEDEMAILSPEAQRFYEDAYQEQDAQLDPPTSPAWIHTLIEFFRNHED